MNKKELASPAAIFGMICFAAAAVLFFIHPYLAAGVLFLFVAVCLAAPFLPGAGLFLQVTKAGSRDLKSVALTFDDGPDPHTTPFLLDLLARRKVHACFFVTGIRAETHPELIRKILCSGNSIGNHTYTHDVFVMLKSKKTLAREIDAAQDVLKTFGVRPLAFRPPVGIVSPGLGPLLEQRKMFCLHYSRRGFDIGNRRVSGLSQRILKKIRPGDIVLLHDTCPGSADLRVETWLAEIENMLSGIDRKGLCVRPLSEVINRAVMEREK
ncbi:MAG: polysaccharide deacetylase family protein [Desulfobacteraceae bacterium]|nr:polysaccharide deacetylase family protein [Desulfobacteraceae bacterium]